MSEVTRTQSPLREAFPGTHAFPIQNPMLQPRRDAGRTGPGLQTVKDRGLLRPGRPVPARQRGRWNFRAGHPRRRSDDVV